MRHSDNTLLSTAPRPSSSQKWQLARNIVLLLIAAGYLLQLYSPFRLQTDSIYLHSIAIGIFENRTPDLNVEFWPGFPWILACLEAIGLGSSPGFIGFNLVCIAIGMAASWYVIAADDSKPMAWACVLACLGSWLLIKFCTIALTDIPCMASSMLAIHYCTRAAKGSPRSAAADLMAAALCTAGACTIRPNAIALLPALGVALLSTAPFRRLLTYLHSLPLALKFTVSASTILVAAFFVSLLTTSRYSRELMDSLGNAGVSSFLLNNLSLRSLDCAETIINTPARFLPRSAMPLLSLLGGSAFLWLFVSAVARLPRLRPSDAYLLAFITILAVWPYRDPRFLIPALPLVFRAWFLVTQRLHPAVRTCCAALFAAGTVAAFAFSTSLTLSGEAFASRYSNELANSYRFAASQPLVDSDPPPLTKVVALIQRYGDARINATQRDPRHEEAKPTHFRQSP